MAGELQAGQRPEFDFDGVLELARKMYEVADDIKDTSGFRAAERDAALAKWAGGVGDDFRQRAVNENTSCVNTSNALRQNANEWAQQWADNVNELNRVLQSEAWETYQSKHNRDLAERQREQRQNAAREVLSDIGDLNPFGGDDSLEKMPEADLMTAPAAPDFIPAREPFASYNVDGDTVTITYVSYQPAPYSAVCV